MAIRSELRHTLSWCLRQDEFTVMDAAGALGIHRYSIRRQFMYFIRIGVMERTQGRHAHGVEFVYRVTDKETAYKLATEMPKERGPSVKDGRSSKTHIPKINSVFALGSL